MAAQVSLVEYGASDSEADVDAPAGPPIKKMKKKRSYTIEKKIEALDMLRAGRSQRSVSIHFRVDKNTIRDWKRQEDKLRKTNKNGKRLPGGGRPLKDSDLDNKVLDWIREQASKEGQELLKPNSEDEDSEDEDSEDEEEDGIKCSSGWLERFIKRHNLSYRRAAITCQKAPADYEKYVVDFIRYVETLRENEQYAHIYAADETAVWLDMANGKCITEKGAREVAVLTTGHDKVRIAVMLTARSDGYKCRPFVLLDRKRPDKEIIEHFGQKLVLCWQRTVWMNGECMQQYLQTIFKKSPIAPVKRLLIWDAYRVHLSEATKGYLHSVGVHMAVIPGGHEISAGPRRVMERSVQG